jgi:hypothetical protein
MSERTSVSLDPETHKKAKLRAVELGISIQSAADQAFELWLSKGQYVVKKQKISQKANS